MTTVFVVIALACLALVGITVKVARQQPGWRVVGLRALTLAAYVGAVLVAGHLFSVGWPGVPGRALAWQVTFLAWGAQLMLLWPLTRSAVTAVAGALAPLAWLTFLVADARTHQAQGDFPPAWLGSESYGPLGQPIGVFAMVATGVVAVLLAQLRGRDRWFGLVLLPVGGLLSMIGFLSLVSLGS